MNPCVKPVEVPVQSLISLKIITVSTHLNIGGWSFGSSVGTVATTFSHHLDRPDACCSRNSLTTSSRGKSELLRYSSDDLVPKLLLLVTWVFSDFEFFHISFKNQLTLQKLTHGISVPVVHFRNLECILLDFGKRGHLTVISEDVRLDLQFHVVCGHNIA